ncbi:carbon starvation protein A [Spirochaetia bacterium]|nr:carbon starvation protein A [Spirochaetia bacterium]
MNGLTLLVISVVVLALAYVLYGRYLARKWGVDPARKTPAREFEDGMEYVPTPPAVVFGHEFASIAGAGPINGPIIAAMFGWLPVLLWLLLGTVFFGAVHDFAALYTSVRNKGKSIGYVIELYVGKAGKRFFLLFVWLFSILIAGAFADIVAGTFEGSGANGVAFPTNAKVASTSSMFILAAIVLGFSIRKKKASDWTSGIIAVFLLIVCIALGFFFPVYFSRSVWLYWIFGYIFAASVSPVWLLGQPRNYLNSFLLIATIIAAFIGIVFARPAMLLPAFTGFEVNGTLLFPGLFITIACGAISGFHSMVATGATSKQLNNETYMLPVSYGAMLMETLVGVLALITVGSLAVGGKTPEGTPVMIFASGVSSFLTRLGLPVQVSFTIVSLAVSSFVLTTLDTVARLGRMSFQELFTSEVDDGSRTEPAVTLLRRVMGSKAAASAFTLIPAYLLAILGYETIWALFGAANQLLAALTLIACMLFLKKSKRAVFMLIIPTVLMLIVTFSSLILTLTNKITKLGEGSFTIAGDGVQFVIAAVLLVLALMVAVSCTAKFLEDGSRNGAEWNAP